MIVSGPAGTGRWQVVIMALPVTVCIWPRRPWRHHDSRPVTVGRKPWSPIMLTWRAALRLGHQQSRECIFCIFFEGLHILRILHILLHILHISASICHNLTKWHILHIVWHILHIFFTYFHAYCFAYFLAYFVAYFVYFTYLFAYFPAYL